MLNNLVYNICMKYSFIPRVCYRGDQKDSIYIFQDVQVAGQRTLPDVSNISFLMEMYLFTHESHPALPQT